MKFIEFKNNVEQWAAERGIYEHSTTEAQLMKALSELGELADAIIKGDDEALKDAVGDVAVCMINAEHMFRGCLHKTKKERQRGYSIAMLEKAMTEQSPFYRNRNDFHVASIAVRIGEFLTGRRNGCVFFETYIALFAISKNAGFHPMDCCEHAWNEIKDRKGRMVAGGAFVKEGEL